MTPLSRIQKDSGRLVLVVFVCLLTAWALALVRQAEQYVPDSVVAPDVSDLQESRRRLLDVTPQSLLEQFYRELDTHTRRLDPTGAEAPSPGDVVVVLYPRVEAPARLQ